MSIRKTLVFIAVIATMLLVTVSPSHAQIPTGTEFTYRGTLERNGIPFTGDCNFEFTLYDMESNGTLIAGPEELDNESVSNGLFVVTLDFGSEAFDGSVRYLEIEVECPAGDKSNLTTLSPRQLITASPYSLSLHGGLDSAYDSGAAINADNGPVEINGTGGLNIEGNVGIGTNSPGAALDVRDTISVGTEGVPNGNNGVLESPVSVLINIDSNNNETDREFLVSANRTGSNAGDPLFRITEDGTATFEQGNVGIGTDSPEDKLTITESGDLFVKLEGGSKAALRLKDNNSASGHQSWQIHADSNALIFDHMTDDFSSTIEPGIILTGNGLGVGTDSPETIFHVNGTSLFEPSLELRSNSAPTDQKYWQFHTQDAGMYIGTWDDDHNEQHIAYQLIRNGRDVNGHHWYIGDNTNSFLALGIDSQRNVGIGTSTPQAKLHITGVSGTDGIRFPDGTLQTTASQNSGPLNQNLNLNGKWISGDGDDEGMFVDNDGNVGIGTETPATHLDIKSNTDTKLRINSNNSDGEAVLQLASEPDGGNTWEILREKGGTLSIAHHQTSLQPTPQDPSTRLVSVSTDGNVGIGTDNPQRPIHVVAPDGSPAVVRLETVNSTNNPTVELWSADQKWQVTNRNNGGDKFEIIDGTLDIERFVIDKQGDVGIGTTNPVTKLQVEHTDRTGLSVINNSSSNTGLHTIYTNSLNNGSAFHVEHDSDPLKGMVFTYQGNLGVGFQNFPDEVLGKVHIRTDAVTGSPSVNEAADDLVIENMNNQTGAGITILSDSNRNGAIYFAHNSNESDGSITYDHPAGSLRLDGREEVLFQINGTEKMRVDTNGNVGIGATNPVTALHVVSGTPGGVPGGVDGLSTLVVQNNGNNGDNAEMTMLAGIGAEAVINFGHQTDYNRGQIRYDFLTSNDPSGESLQIYASDEERVRIDGSGHVGIGTDNPSTRLHIVGSDSEVEIGGASDASTGDSLIRVLGGNSHVGNLFHVRADGQDVFIIENNGSVNVGGSTVHTPDYVFEADYELMTLQELREFIANEKHLPNVPSSADIAKNGLNMTAFQMQLLEKTEELVLYTLQQDEQIHFLERRQTLLLSIIPAALVLLIISNFVMLRLMRRKV